MGGNEAVSAARSSRQTFEAAYEAANQLYNHQPEEDMSIITAAAARWPALVAEREFVPNPNGPTASALRAKAIADWLVLRDHIFHAIENIRQELSNLTVGTDGTPSFGQIHLTTKNVLNNTGVIADIQLSLKTTSTPPLAGFAQILVTDNYKISMGLPAANISAGLWREYDIGELLAGDVDRAVRLTVSDMMR